MVLPYWASPEQVHPGEKVQNNKVAWFFVCLHELNFWMYVRDAWWIRCSTRSGVPRINQTYSSYPAGTDILFDATEVRYSSLLLHLHCPSDLYCQLGFRVFLSKELWDLKYQIFFCKRWIWDWDHWGCTGWCEGFWRSFHRRVALKKPSSFRGLQYLVFITSQTSEFISHHWFPIWINAYQI